MDDMSVALYFQRFEGPPLPNEPEVKVLAEAVQTPEDDTSRDRIADYSRVTQLPPTPNEGLPDIPLIPEETDESGIDSGSSGSTSGPVQTVQSGSGIPEHSGRMIDPPVQLTKKNLAATRQMFDPVKPTTGRQVCFSISSFWK